MAERAVAKMPMKDGSVKEFVQVVAVVEDRHDVTGEPTRLRVIQMDEKVDLREENQFVVFWGCKDTFDLTTRES